MSFLPLTFFVSGSHVSSSSNSSSSSTCSGSGRSDLDTFVIIDRISPASSTLSLGFGHDSLDCFVSLMLEDFKVSE
jgi:hypothetical protein